MKTQKQINIVVGVVVPYSLQELILEAVLSYFGLTKQEFFSQKKNIEASRRRAILFLLTKTECNLSETQIANYYKVTRQTIGWVVSKLENEVNKDIYLQNTCDINAIKGIFASLRKEQEQWLTNLSQLTSTTP